MKKRYLLWYLAGTLLVLAPAAVRALTWPRAADEPVDSAMASAGQNLFSHQWTVNDPLSPGGDGLGPVYNATSCAACHHKGGTGGSGGVEHNVTIFSIPPRTPSGRPREGVVHAQAVKYRETLSQVEPGLPEDVSQPTLQWVLERERLTQFGSAGARFSQRNTPALFGAKLIDEIPDRVIIAQERLQRVRWGMEPASTKEVPVGRAFRLPDGRIGKFGWKGQSASLTEFVQAACANELGLGNPGQAQPTPLGKSDYQPPGLDLTLEQCNQLTAFISSLPRPVEKMPDVDLERQQAQRGKELFTRIGCAECHAPNLGSVEGIYSDLLMHRMGEDLQGSGSYNQPFIPQPEPSPDSPPDEWRTPPLWGVADSGPYLHDGRAATLQEAIQQHGGQGARSRSQFLRLDPQDQACLIGFLKSLRAPN